MQVAASLPSGDGALFDQDDVALSQRNFASPTSAGGYSEKAYKAPKQRTYYAPSRPGVADMKVCYTLQYHLLEALVF